MKKKSMHIIAALILSVIMLGAAFLFESSKDAFVFNIFIFSFYSIFYTYYTKSKNKG